MLTTNPEHNSPQKDICAKCGKSFIRAAWSGVYSINGSVRYKFADSKELPLVSLCDKCAQEELSANRVGRLLY